MKEKDLLDLGYKKYEGETYDVYFNKDVCKHSGNCVKANHIAAGVLFHYR